MTNNPTLIYYAPGAYGTFIEWCLNYFTDLNFSETLPFTNTGSSHNFYGNFTWNEFEFNHFVYSQSFMRGHPGSFNNEASKLLELPKSYENLLSVELNEFVNTNINVVFLYFSTGSWIWGINNYIEKVSSAKHLTYNQKISFLNSKRIPEEKHIIFGYTGIELIKKSLIYSGASKFVSQWGKSSIDDLELWELREFLSLYYPLERIDNTDNQIFDNIKNKFTNILMIEISELRDNFEETLKKIITKTGRQIVREEKINEIYSEWIEIQEYKNKDALIHKIVYNLINVVDFSWNQLTLIDESFLQYYLRLAGIEIKCWGLNEFPTNTHDFLPLLERK